MAGFEDRGLDAGAPMGAGAESTEVASVGRRRTFTAEYKRRILDEADRAVPGEIGLLLRREGLYSSQLTNWRKWRSGMSTNKKASKKTDDGDISRKDHERVLKENAKLKLKLAKAEAMLELQKKAAAIWEMEDEKSETDS